MRWLPVPSFPPLDENNRRILYLTFDDGPDPKVTPQVLKLLDEYNAKATFFCLGRNVSLNYRIFLEIQARGHLACNHTYSHPKGWYTQTRKYLEDVERAAKYFENRFFRPPYGKIGIQQYLMLKKKYTFIFWHVLSRDYNVKKNWRYCFERVKNKSMAGSVVVFHDSTKAAPRMLPCLEATLKHFTALGYVFHSLKDSP